MHRRHRYKWSQVLRRGTFLGAWYGCSNYLVIPSASTPSTLTLPGQTRNVVLFGECGVGKSSIINRILGQPLARTSNDVEGCTDKTASYPVTLDTGIKINLWDTIGLDEGTFGKVPADRAKQYLKSFLQGRMIASDGIDLLLYCVRGASGAKSLPVKWGHWENYKFVVEEVCKKRVPVAMIVTYLESYDPGGDMDSWWKHNERKILDFGFQFCAHACITILPPDSEGIVGDATGNRFEVSRHKLQDLLLRNFLAPRNVLLLGDREDRDDFINMTIPSRNAEAVSPFTCIPVAFDGHTHVNFWNMNGFDETNDDTLVTEKTLKLLVRGIKQTPGIDLLLFCFRAGRPRIRHARNYKLFYAVICRKKVPVAVAVLGPELEEGIDTWWERNEQGLRRKGFVFDRHICIPCNPCQLPSGNLDDATRHRLIDLVQEEYTSRSWNIGDDPFWVTVPNVRAVVGELSWPTTTIVVCDATKQDAFSGMAPGVQSSLRCAVMPQREHRFQQVDPKSLSPVTVVQSSGSIHIADQGSKDVSLIVFFMRTEKPDDEAWGILEKFYSIYRGTITPFIVVVCGAPERKAAEDFWKAAPRHIRRRVGAYLTYHPGPHASPEALTAAQEIMVEMIQHRCLVDLGDRVGILQEILSVWRKYRSQRNGVSDRATK